MSRKTPLKKFSFKYDSFPGKIPRVPIRFVRKDGESTPIIDALLDSGCDCLVIREDLAKWLGIELKENKGPTFTAGGQKKSFYGNVPTFILGRGGREVIYEDIEIRVIQDNPAFLVGINPVFEDYLVQIDAKKEKIILTPND